MVHTTLNGYRTKDALAALDRALTAANDPSSVCSLAAEVFCTPTEAPCLVAFLVDHVAAKRCSTCLPQIALLERMLSNLHARSLDARKQKTYAYADADVRRSLCHCVLTIMDMRVKALKVDADVSALRRKLKAHDKAKSATEHALEGCDVAIDSAVALALIQLADVTLTGDKSERVLSTVVCVARVHKGHSVPGLEKWPCVRNVKPSLRNKTQFAMWRLATILARLQCNPCVADYVAHLFQLYMLGLCKTNADGRLNLLLYAFVSINRRDVRHTMPPESPHLASAVQRVDILFQDIINSSTSYSSSSQTQEQQRVTTNDTKADANDNMHLRMYTLLTDSAFGTNARIDMDFERDLKTEFDTHPDVKSIAIPPRGQLHRHRQHRRKDNGQLLLRDVP